MAVAPWQVDELAEARDEMVAAGQRVQWFDGPAMRAEIASPTYLGGLWKQDGCAMVDPARLTWGLARAGAGSARASTSARVSRPSHVTAPECCCAPPAAPSAPAA